MTKVEKIVWWLTLILVLSFFGWAWIAHAQSFRGPGERASSAVKKSPIGSSSIQKANGTGGFSNAVSGTDYQPAIAGNTLAAHNFANQINTAGTLLGAQPAAGDIAAGTFAGADTFSTAPIFSSISGSTQCLQVNSSGQTSGTGSSCGTTGFIQATTSTVAMVAFGGL